MLSNLAYQTQPKNQEHPIQQPKIKKQKQESQLFTPGEKMVIFFLSLVIGIGAIFIVSNQASIYQTNNEIQALEQKIEKQEKTNLGLEEKAEELKTPERILEIAQKLGLSINENNIQMIQK